MTDSPLMNRIFSTEHIAGTKKAPAMLVYALALLGTIVFSGCSQHEQNPGDFRAEEIELIDSADSIMRVLTIADPCDSLILRDTSRTFSAKALLSENYDKLCSLMVATVTHPSQDGVGIAGPQVGLNRRVVAVQRFDKAGEPFEVYPNIRIIYASDSLSLLVASMEGNTDLSEEQMEALRNSPEENCVLKLTVLCDDGQGNTQYNVYRFYRYTERKAYFTVEVLDSPTDTGNPTEAQGVFYVLRSFCDKLIADAYRFMEGTEIVVDSKN